ncbi:CgeB family protein [Maridesulfovibrio sp.]|uniref:CgeB family protein n=1 Tax=Maridesulfovibrio sp. TaxID=2795000 RepID=UPI0039EF7785
MLKINSIRGQKPRILFITHNYFVVPELTRAMQQSAVELSTIDIEPQNDFLKRMFDRIETFKPHFILSINHLGLDAEGQVLGLLKRCNIPFASWFVDRPEIYMETPVDSSALLAIFCWDPKSIPFFKKRNVKEAHYLPLGADPSIFYPKKNVAPEISVSFVGASWTTLIVLLLKAGRFNAPLLQEYKKLGSLYESSSNPELTAILGQMKPSALEAYATLSTHEQNLFHNLIAYEATRQRRVKIVSKILKFRPVIVGDRYWKLRFAASNEEFSWWSSLDYEQGLPDFYRNSAVNFNTTSLKSKLAMNQRIFDVPACGAFLLTEASKPLENLFEPGKEVACYTETSSIPETVARWLRSPEERGKIAQAGRRRVLAEHTYQHRLAEIIQKMRVFF